MAEIAFSAIFDAPAFGRGAEFRHADFGMESEMVWTTQGIDFKGIEMVQYSFISKTVQILTKILMKLPKKYLYY